MKKFTSLVLSILLISLSIVALTSCGQKESGSDTDSDKLSIITTIFPYYDFARNIAGDKADIRLLLYPGSEPHSYEPSPSDIVAIENCDIFIYNGGESDEWVESVLNSLQSKNVKILRMMDYITPMYEQSSEHSHEEEDSEHSHGDEYDEHIWTSVRNAQNLVSSISEVMSQIDKKNSNIYNENENKYLEKLLKLDDEFSEIVQNGVRKEVVFGDRFPFLYFVTDYGLSYECAFPGCSSETEPSISTVTHLIDYVRNEKIPVVFYLDFSNDKTAQLIAEDTGAKTLLFFSCHNVTKVQFEDGESYVSLMEHNADVLKEALS